MRIVIGEEVLIKATKTHGIVLTNTYDECMGDIYLVRYSTNTLNNVEHWFRDSSLEAIGEQQMSKFKYEIGSTLAIKESGEVGHVIGRAEYETAEPAYLLRYCANDRRATEQWWSEGALLKAGVVQDIPND